MPSAKQIAANRRNAQRSTGPRSVQGKVQSSQNAVRHGLARKIASDAEVAETIALALAVESPLEIPTPVRQALAQSMQQLSRIRKLRADLLEECISGTADSTAVAVNLSALERYERRALSSRKRAIHKLTNGRN